MRSVTFSGTVDEYFKDSTWQATYCVY